MATSFATPVNSISGYVAYPFRASGGDTLTFTLPHGIPSSAFYNNGWVRVTIISGGVPKVILKATNNPSTTTLHIASGTLEGTTDYTCVDGDIAELRITAGAFSDIQTAVNELETGTNAVTKIGNSVVSGTNNCVLYVDGSGHLGNTAAFKYAVTGGAQVVTVGDNTSQVGFNFYYAGETPTADFGGFWNGTAQVSIGFDNRALFGVGSIGETSGREIHFYDAVAGTMPGGMTSDGAFNWGFVGWTYATKMSIRSDGTIRPSHLADSGSVANDSIYYSTTSSKLVYKDGSGVVHALY